MAKTERPRPVPPPAKPARPAAPVPPTPTPTAQAAPAEEPPRVTYRCGHHKRLAEFAKADCPDCRAKRKAGKNMARKAKHATAAVTHDRLPPGSSKRLLWNGMEWYGVLEVPGFRRFEFRADSEKKCYHGLDGEFRKALAVGEKVDELGLIG